MKKALVIVLVVFFARFSVAQNIGEEIEGSVHERLRARIDFSQLVFRRGLNEISGPSPLMDSDMLIETLSSIARDSFSGTSLLDGTNLFVGKDILVEINKLTGKISSDFLNDKNLLPTNDVTEDEVLIASSKNIMLALGAHPDEINDAIIRNIGAESDYKHSDGIEKPKRIARVVYVKREINNIGVLDERIAFVYDLTGKLISMNGRWTDTSYKESKLTTQFSKEEFVDVAIDFLIDENINVDGFGDIELSTQYKTKQLQSGKFIVELYGLAHIELQGPEVGSIKHGEYSFSLIK